MYSATMNHIELFVVRLLFLLGPADESGIPCESKALSLEDSVYLFSN